MEEESTLARHVAVTIYQTFFVCSHETDTSVFTRVQGCGFCHSVGDHETVLTGSQAKNEGTTTPVLFDRKSESLVLAII